jgi:hypothetical protein
VEVIVVKISGEGEGWRIYTSSDVLDAWHSIDLRDIGHFH